METLEDVLYEVDDGIAWITINRPERLNALRAQTVDELIDVFHHAGTSAAVGAVILTGAGERAFCAGGDQKQMAETGDYGPSRFGVFEIERLHRVIRDVPKPTIAAVGGVAIGGGHVLHLLCDLTIAARGARFGQVGPRVGSFDAGFGTAYLARVVGEKRAREIWFLCRQYSADEALTWGLVNVVVELPELRSTAEMWAREILRMSPTALKFLKHSFNADTQHIIGFSQLAFDSLDLFVATDESGEGHAAFTDRRPPDFSAFRGS